MPVFVMITKMGISSAYMSSWLAPVGMFPTLFQATAFGIFSFTSNLVTIAAPQIAQMEDPIPMLVIALSTALGIVLSLFINEQGNRQ